MGKQPALIVGGVGKHDLVARPLERQGPLPLAGGGVGVRVRIGLGLSLDLDLGCLRLWLFLGHGLRCRLWLLDVRNLRRDGREPPQCGGVCVVQGARDLQAASDRHRGGDADWQEVAGQPLGHG